MRNEKKNLVDDFLGDFRGENLENFALTKFSLETHPKNYN